MSGFFGSISKRTIVGDVFYGTDYHSHLGTKRAGMAFWKEGKIVRSIHSLENGYFRNKFEDDLPKFEGSYSGVGVISDNESQPVTITSHLGRFSVVTVAKFGNLEQVVNEMLENGSHFAELSGSDINPTEAVAMLISRGKDFADGLEIAQNTIKGSCSILVLTPEGIYASRDRFGRTPIVIGKDADGYVVASESSSFTNLGYDTVRDIDTGEVVLLTASGIEVKKAPRKRKQICSFLWIYYGYPSAWYEGINVEESRYRCGAALARRDREEGLSFDFAGAIPDSGIGHAIGYSNELSIPYKRPFVKYTPTWPRSFMPQNQNMRDLVAKMKLLPNKEFTQNSSMVLLDDSIVRGTQLKDNVIKLLENGAREVHMRIACPPLIFPCKFLNFSASRSAFDLITLRVIAKLEGTENLSDELLAQYVDHTSEKHKAMVEKIARQLQLTSLKFQHLDDVVKSIGLPKEQLCTHCWDNSSYEE